MSNRDGEFGVAQEAAHWVIRLQSDQSESCRLEFDVWARQSREHVKEFLLAMVTWKQLDVIGPQSANTPWPQEKRFKLFRAAIVKRLPPMPIPAQRAARLLDAQYHGAVIQWALEPKGRLADFVAQKVHFRCGAKRVLRNGSLRNPQALAPTNLLEPECDEVDNRDHQALQAG